MAGGTDLDLAIAVALAESNEAFSDDDFKPSGVSQKLLFKTCRNSCRPSKKKQLKKKPDKKENCPTLAGKDKVGLNQGEDLSRDASLKRTVGKEVSKATSDPRQEKVLVNVDVKRPTSFSVAELDNFRFKGRLKDSPTVAQAFPFMKNGSKSDLSTTKLNSLVEIASPPQSGAGNFSRCGSVSSNTADCLVIDINTDVVVEPSDESQFSVLLRLCGEESVQGEDSAEVSRIPTDVHAAPVHSISAFARPTDSVLNKESPPGWGLLEAFESIADDVTSASLMDTVLQGSAERGFDVEKDASPSLEVNQTYVSDIQQGNGTEWQNSQDQFCEDNTEDISSMMTQVDTVLQGSAARDLDVDKHAFPAINANQADVSDIHEENDTGHLRQESQNQMCEDNTDGLSSMMTQRCTSKLEEVEFPQRTSPSPLQDISNVSTRPNTDKQWVTVKSIIQVADRVDSPCEGTDEAADKNETLPARRSVLQAPGMGGSSEDDHYLGNMIIEGSPCGATVVKEPAISGHTIECPHCSEGHEAVVVENAVPPNEEVGATITCPLCGDNISDISVEMRVTHTNTCLDKLDSAQGCPEENGLRTAPSLVPASDQVRDWLETLSLSRYASLFVEQEIDWDTLQWLTDEDLFVMGITAVGPRKKILRAIQELNSGSGGSRTETVNIPVAVRPAVGNTSRDPQLQISEEDRVTRNPQANGGEPNSNLITNYFPLPLEFRKKQTLENSVTNMVHQSAAGAKQIGVYENKATKRPRSSVYQNKNGVPVWMCIPGTPFRVDAFQHLSGDCSHWFLTHFHTDHYQGLTRGFRYGHIFCSLITARLVNLRIGVSWDKLMIIPLNEKFKIAGVDVTFLDANHCPGSVMILFEPPNGEAVLHTGDFRFCTEMVNNSVLQKVNIHTLVLDTTYCDPQGNIYHLKEHLLKPLLISGTTVDLDKTGQYDFPAQETVIRFVIEAIQAELFNSNTLFLIGTYTIGKERIFLEVAKVLKKYVYIGAPKKRLLECMDLPADDTRWLTCNEHESFIHVVPLWSISSFKRMSSISRHYQGRYKLIVAFSPSGWSFGRGKKKTPGKRWQQGTMIRYEVPYSEHCSFSELKEFLKFIGADNIIPSVPGKSGKGADEMIASLWSEDN